MSVPVELGREAAQQAAREELAKQVYRDAGPGLVERVLGWLYDRAVDLLDGAAGVSPGGYAGVAVLVLLLVAAVVAVRLGSGRWAGGRQRPCRCSPGASARPTSTARPPPRTPRPASGPKPSASACAPSSARLEERSVLEPRPGRTADEAAHEAGLALPTCASALRSGARLFDEVWYGGHPAGPASDETLRALDRQVADARPVRADAPSGRRCDRPVVTTTLAPTAGQLWRRARGPVVVLAVVLLGALALAVLAGGSGSERLDPRSPEPSGSRAVAEVLRDQGVRVDLATTTAGVRACGHGRRHGARGRPRAAGRPAGRLRARDGRRPGGGRARRPGALRCRGDRGTRVRRPACASQAASSARPRRAGAAEVGGQGYEVAATTPTPLLGATRATAGPRSCGSSTRAVR